MSDSTIRWIFHEPAPAAWNMAVDEMLLEQAQGATLRFYGWRQPTLSLGYFQSYDERLAHLPSTNCTAVRRTTGGGAILHDRELTYCFTAACEEGWRWSAQDLYDAFHQTLIECLADYGVCATLANPPPTDAPQPFLCFQRRAEGDVLLGQFKIAGSAQRRRRQAILQHGSVLIARSPFAPELPGICDLTQAVIDRRELAEAWRERVSRRLGLSLYPSELTEAEEQRASRIESEIFSLPDWTKRR